MKKEKHEYDWWQKRLEYLEQMRELGENVRDQLVEAKERIGKFLKEKGRKITQVRVDVKEKDEKCMRLRRCLVGKVVS